MNPPSPLLPLPSLSFLQVTHLHHHYNHMTTPLHIFQIEPRESLHSQTRQHHPPLSMPAINPHSTTTADATTPIQNSFQPQQGPTHNPLLPSITTDPPPSTLMTSPATYPPPSLSTHPEPTYSKPKSNSFQTQKQHNSSPIPLKLNLPSDLTPITSLPRLDRTETNPEIEP